MVLYAHGSLELKPDELVKKFFEKASASLRAHAIWSIGSGLSGTKEEIPDQVLNRIKVLWQWRLEKGKTDPQANLDIL
jgi:hypothetical protein